MEQKWMGRADKNIPPAVINYRVLKENMVNKLMIFERKIMKKKSDPTK
jgi:hypothetical protein